MAIELGQNQSVKLLLGEIFRLNSRDYQEVMMLDLPKFLESDLLSRFYPFLERDHNEFMAIYRDQEALHLQPNREQSSFCNFEDFICHPDLAPFSSEQVHHHVMQDFTDYHNYEEELYEEVIKEDPYMTWAVNSYEDASHYQTKDKKYEVEHSLIDF